jgi:hypothetical protein
LQPDKEGVELKKSLNIAGIEHDLSSQHSGPAIPAADGGNVE